MSFDLGAATNRFLHSVDRLRDRIAERQNRLSSGKRVHRASDDPTVVGSILRLRDLQTQTLGFDRNQLQLRGKFDVTESHLTDLDNLLVRARELALQALGPVGTNNGTEAISNQVFGLYEDALRIANSQHDGSYLFGGTASAGEPYTDGGGLVTYNGNDDELQVEIYPAHFIVANLPGSQVFQKDVDIFEVLDSLATAIQAGDDGIVNQELGRLDTAEDQVGAALVRVGLRQTRLADAGSRLTTLNYNTVSVLDDYEAADPVEEAAGLIEDNTSLETAIAAHGRSNTRTLFDYLG